jgi:hypothetical protein
MREFRYFFSYGWSGDNEYGVGNVEISLKRDIKSMKEIKAIEEYIVSNYSGNRINFKAVVLHWHKFGKT